MEEISYRLPMVFTFISNIFTIAEATTTAISEPGILLLILGHKIKIAIEIAPIKKAHTLIDATLSKHAINFSNVSTGRFPKSKSEKILDLPDEDSNCDTHSKTRGDGIRYEPKQSAELQQSHNN